MGRNKAIRPIRKTSFMNYLNIFIIDKDCQCCRLQMGLIQHELEQGNNVKVELINKGDNFTNQYHIKKT